MRPNTHEVKVILEKALGFVCDTARKSEQKERSLCNCHTEGVFSIWLADNLRVFMVLDEEGIPLWSKFDTELPHNNNESFLLHNHRYPLTSIPLSDPSTTQQLNVLYEEVADTQTFTETYKKYRYYSALFEEDKKAKYVTEGKVLLKRTSYSLNEPWFMEENDIHRIVWKGPIIALLQEHKEVGFVNKNPTEAFLVDSAERIPCEQFEHSLYQPITAQDFELCVSKLQNALQRSLLERYRLL